MIPLIGLVLFVVLLAICTLRAAAFEPPSRPCDIHWTRRQRRKIRALRRKEAASLTALEAARLRNQRRAETKAENAKRTAAGIERARQRMQGGAL
jgi:hypothetical protein